MLVLLLPRLNFRRKSRGKVSGQCLETVENRHNALLLLNRRDGDKVLFKSII